MLKRRFTVMSAGTLLAIGAGSALFSGLIGADTSTQITPTEGIESAPQSTIQEVIPYRDIGSGGGGNTTCADVGQAYFGDPQYYTFASHGQDPWYEPYAGGGSQVNNPGIAQGFLDFFGITIDGVHLAFNTAGKTFTDGTNLYPLKIGAVIMKGGNDANVYAYEPQVQNDSGLASPATPAGGPAGLSNLTFCWNPVQEEDPPQEIECWGNDETAWGAGDRYVVRGNWATYTSYSACQLGAKLYAGQTEHAGTVQCVLDDGSVAMTISMNAGWRFAPLWDKDAMDCVRDATNACLAEPENVKVQDYLDAPQGNPAPGLFAHKATAAVVEPSFTLSVPVNEFYGVHVNVRRFGEEYCMIE